MRRVVALLGGILLTGGAMLVVAGEPGIGDVQAPIPVPVQLGERGHGRDVVAQIDEVSLADTVATEDWTGETSGVWLVVQAQAAMGAAPGLVSGKLTIGERTWWNSDRAELDSLDSVGLAPGLPWAGAMLFELPSEVLAEPAAAHARLDLAAANTPVLDSAIRLELDLAGLERTPRLDLAPPRRVVW